MKLKDRKGKQLVVRKAASLCIVRSEEIKSDNDEFVIQFRAANLPKAGWYIIYKNALCISVFLYIAFEGQPLRNCEYVPCDLILSVFFLSQNRMSKSNPYLQIYREAQGGGWMSVMRTKTIRKSSDPQWGKIKVAMQRLCNGDYSRKLLIRCFHDEDNAAPKEIGHCQTSVQELLDLQS